MVVYDAATPLWRNGPPEKPVLCNACGSRYRLRGTLLNYAPKHLMVIPSSSNNKIKNKNKRRNTIVKTENNFANSFFHVPSTATATASDHEADVSNKSTSFESQTSSGSTTSSSSYAYHDDKESNGSQLPGSISFYQSLKFF
ncbi:hypothetical protein QYF36_018985 [Acer negundo]|nr:hypothetical protein QYF36_007466 [Acer negundo]KAK4846550.1 hypothetical protein QYF36_018985 [Acer negundo]